MQPGARRPFQRRRLRYDRAHALEAGYAVDKGIPWHEYLARWTNADRAIVQAVLAEHALRCQICGTAPWEWENADGSLNPGAFRAVSSVCLGDAALERMRKSQEGGSGVPGSSLRLVPEDVVLSQQARGARRPVSARERRTR